MDVPDLRAPNIERFHFSTVVGARAVPDAHASRVDFVGCWLVIQWSLASLRHTTFHVPPAPPRLHWLSDVTLGGAWAAVARALDGFGNRTSLLQSNLTGCRTVSGRAPARHGEKLVLRKDCTMPRWRECFYEVCASQNITMQSAKADFLLGRLLALLD